jgi:hypothetical protein
MSIGSHVGIESILFVVEENNILILIYFLDKINIIMEIFYRENNGNYPGCQVHTCPPDGRRGSSFPDKIGISCFAYRKDRMNSAFVSQPNPSFISLNPSPDLSVPI